MKMVIHMKEGGRIISVMDLGESYIKRMEIMDMMTRGVSHIQEIGKKICVMDMGK